MGTRNVTIVKLDNKIVLTKYCQWDGYPTGQGADLCGFIKDKMDLRALKKNLKTIEVISDEEVDNIFNEYQEKRSQLEKLLPNSFEHMDARRNAVRALQLEMVPLITRDTGGGDVLESIQNRAALKTGNTKGDLDYAKGKDGFSFGCEYVYEVDLDNKKLSVYDGLYKGKPAKTYSFDTIKRCKDVGNLMRKLEEELYGDE